MSEWPTYKGEREGGIVGEREECGRKGRNCGRDIVEGRVKGMCVVRTL